MVNEIDRWMVLTVCVVGFAIYVLIVAVFLTLA
jgi:hypothetical protein